MKSLIISILIYTCLTAIVWCRISSYTTTNQHQAARNPITPHQRHRLSTSHTTTTSGAVRGWPCDDVYVCIPIAFVIMLYLVYLVECWHCHTRLDLGGRVDVQTVYRAVAAMRQALPVIWWKVVCYHYVRRARHVTRYRNGEAYTAAHAYYERVNSRSATSAFNYAIVGVTDVSKKLADLEKYPTTKIYITKSFSFDSIEAEREFVGQRSSFFHDYEQLDDYVEFRESIDLANSSYRDHMIVSNGDRHPWYITSVAFWLASLLLMSWPMRLLIQYKTAFVCYNVHKMFGSYTNQVRAAGCHGRSSFGSRVSTLESSDLEKTIMFNTSIVPSYSEALLMDFERDQSRVSERYCHRKRSCEVKEGVLPSFGTAFRVSSSASILNNPQNTDHWLSAVTSRGCYGSISSTDGHVTPTAKRSSSLWSSLSKLQGQTGRCFAIAHAQSTQVATSGNKPEMIAMKERKKKLNTRTEKKKAVQSDQVQASTSTTLYDVTSCSENILSESVATIFSSNDIADAYPCNISKSVSCEFSTSDESLPSYESALTMPLVIFPHSREASQPGKPINQRFFQPSCRVQSWNIPSVPSKATQREDFVGKFPGFEPRHRLNQHHLHICQRSNGRGSPLPRK